MLYINITDFEVVVVQTTKSLVAQEKVIGVARKQIAKGLIVDGVIKNGERLQAEIQELLSQAHPKEIKEKTASIIVSDKQIFTKRFSMDKDLSEDELASKLVDEVKKSLSYDVDSLVSFYQPVKTTDTTQEILYTSMLKTVAANYIKFFATLGIKVTFLSSRIFAYFEFLRPVIPKDESVLYCEIDKDEVSYTLLDEYGPLNFETEKISEKSLTVKIKSIMGILGKQNLPKITKVIIGGYGSIEFQKESLADNLDVKVYKMGDVIEQILGVHKIELDSGGVAKLLFASSLGALVLANSSQPPNYASEIDSSATEVTAEPVLSETASTSTADFEKSATAAAEETKPKEENAILEKTDESSILAGQITEHKKFSLDQIFSNKIFILALSIIGGIVLIFGLFSIVSGESGSLPFMAKPTLTPTPTVEPTVTPTPTIDPSLERTDLKLSVENGTDVTGYAGDTAEYLEEQGYENVAKSNADKDDYDKSIIKIKKDKENYLPLLKKDLEDKIDTSTVENLDEDDKYDVVIILGKE